MPPISVTVVGAGPVGLLITLRLARAEIPVICLDALPEIDASPRAMAYHPIAVRELDRAGVLDDCRRPGSTGRGICWRKTSDKEIIAFIERTPTEEFPYENLVVGQHELAAVILEHLKAYPNAEVRFNAKVTAVSQPPGSETVSITLENPEGKEETLTSTYAIAADGGRSTMRRLLDISFPGFTYPEQLVSTNVHFDFEAHGWLDGNFMVDPEHWALIGRITNDGLWRVSYGEKDGLSHDEIKGRMDWKFEQMFPGEKPVRYRLEQMSPYRLNQRCAERFREGRVLLAGDAAHLCNPFGGLGLCGGILDAAALSDALIGIHEDLASDKVLDVYAEERRKTFLEIVNPTSQANKERMHDPDPQTLGERDPFLRMLRDATSEEKQNVRQNAKLALDISEFFDLKANGIKVSGERVAAAKEGMVR